MNPSAARLRFDRFELDESEARLTRAGEPVTLAPRPFGVLCALARNPGHLVTKNALLDLVWGHRFVSESALKMAISVLRAALDDDPKQPRYIETVSRRGYRFIAAATRSPMQGAATQTGRTRATRAIPVLLSSRRCAAAMSRSPTSSGHSPPRLRASGSSSTIPSEETLPAAQFRAPAETCMSAGLSVASAASMIARTCSRLFAFKAGTAY